jgi:hypothetical protein
MTSAQIAKSRLKTILHWERIQCFQLNWAKEEKDAMSDADYTNYLTRVRAFIFIKQCNGQ